MKEQILAHLPFNFPWRDWLYWFDSIGSTNDEARRRAKQGASHGTVLIAGHQSAGHGRLGRGFHSPEDAGVYLSVILRPGCAPTELMHLTCAAAVAMCAAVEKTAGFRPGIKWTNDLVFGKRKLGGILTELGFTAQGTVDYAIIGIGINCSQKSEDFPEDIRHIAASLFSVSGKTVDRSRVAAAMVEALKEMDDALLTGKADILRQYRSDCVTLGQEIMVVRGDETRYGKALDIDENGALTVAFSHGDVETVNSGEVSVRGMYGYI